MNEPDRQLVDIADAIGVMAEGLQGPYQGINRLDAVELRRLFFCVTCCQVLMTKIVGDADFHRQSPAGLHEATRPV